MVLKLRWKSKLKLIAKVISRLFDPVIIIPLILTGTVGMAYLNGYRWKFFLFIFFLDAVVPGLFVFWRYLKNKGKDWDIHKREERIPLFMLTVVSHGLGVIVAYLLGRHPLAEILLGLWLLAVVYTGITMFWKISVHAGVNSTLAVMITLFVDKDLFFIWIIPMIVAWARVEDKHHTWPQVLMGLLVAPMVLYGSYYLWGIV